MVSPIGLKMDTSILCLIVVASLVTGKSGGLNCNQRTKFKSSQNKGGKPRRNPRPRLPALRFSTLLLKFRNCSSPVCKGIFARRDIFLPVGGINLVRT